MAVRTLSQRTMLSAVGGEITYTTSRLIAHPEGAPYVATFTGLREKAKIVQAQEQTLRDAIVDAQAVVDHVDELCDAFVKKLVRVIDGLTDNDRSSKLYTHFLGTKTPSDFSRPVLGPQFADMGKWGESLSNSDHAALKDLASEHTDLMAKGKAAIGGKQSAESARDRFRDVGERFQFIEEVNAKRKHVHGELSKLPHEKQSLPTNFADQFFRRETRAKDEEDEEPNTFEAIDAAIVALQQQIEALKLKRKVLEATADQEKAAQVKAHEDALAALAKKKAEVAAEEAALQAKIDALKNG